MGAASSSSVTGWCRARYARSGCRLSNKAHLFSLSRVFCTFSADVQGFVLLKTRSFVHSLVTCTLHRFRVSAHLTYPFVHSLFRPFTDDTRIIQVQGFFTLETRPFVQSLVMCSYTGSGVLHTRNTSFRPFIGDVRYTGSGFGPTNNTPFSFHR